MNKHDIEDYVIIIPNTTILYHGTPLITRNPLTNTNLWMSTNYLQSILHTFSAICLRYIKYYEQDETLWPCLFRYLPNEDLKLLNLFTYKGIHYMKHKNGHEHILLSDFIDSLDCDKNYGERYSKCSPNEYAGDCNGKILHIIKTHLIQYNIVGYACLNDESEIAIINPRLYLHLDEQLYLSEILNKDNIPMMTKGRYTNLPYSFRNEEFYDINESVNYNKFDIDKYLNKIKKYLLSELSETNKEKLIEYKSIITSFYILTICEFDISEYVELINISYMSNFENYSFIYKKLDFIMS